MSKVVGFVRAVRGSTDVPEQKKAIQAFSTTLGWVVESWYEGQEGYDELLDDVEGGGVRAIVVAQLDILTPTVERLRRLLLALEQDGISFASASEGVTIPGPAADAVRGTLQACARIEWLSLCDLLHAGLEYRYKTKTRGSATKNYGIRPGEELVIEHMRQLRSDELSYEAIAGLLDRDGAPPRRGGRWSRKIVAKLIDRPVRPYRFRE